MGLSGSKSSGASCKASGGASTSSAAGGNGGRGGKWGGGGRDGRGGRGRGRGRGDRGHMGRGGDRGPGGRGGRGRGRESGTNITDERALMAAASAHMLPPQTEEDVGMQCFVNPEAKGFTGVLKQRFTDFIVREVDLQGAVCRLTEAPGLYGTPMPSASLSVEKPDSVEEKEGANGDRDAAPSNLSEEERVKAGVASISLALGSELVNGLDKAILLEVMGSLPSSEMKQVFVVPGVGDKDLRRKVHTLIREHLGDFVETVTVTEDGASSSIVVRTLGGGNGRKRRRGERSDRPMKRSSTSGQERQRQPWPSTLPPYVKFVIYKENMDSNTAQERIRHCAQVPRGSIGVAGTKDRRAATSQWATVRMRTAHDIVQINREAPRGGRIIVGNFSYVNDALDLGDLMGNRFSITLRNVSSADASNGEELSAILSTACNGVMEKGFINFFGLQRFGSGGSRTSDVGRMILKGNWEGAVQGIMRPREGEAAQVHEAKLHFLNHPDDPAGSLRRMPHYMHLERTILMTLNKVGSSAYLPALQALPRHMQTMYLHAAQSEAWNYVSSERVSSLGLQVVEGDLVLENEAQPEGDFLGEDADDLFSVGPDSPLDRGKKARPGLPVPHVVTAEDVQAGRFKLTDVVMPLPGVHVQYPLHSVGEERYASFFAGHGLTLQSLRGTTTSAFTVGGNYRRLIVQPKDMEWEMKQYSDATEQLIPTDIDALSRVGARHETPPGADQPQDFWALCLSFTLPVSSYATVMLFELTKQSMGFHHQRALNSLTAGQLAPQSTST